MNLTRLLVRAAAPLTHLLLLLAVAACSNPGRDALRRASAVIDEHPDSAYAILAAVDPATLRNEADSALYALRWTQALYHTYREDSITSDRLITVATGYYDMQPPSRERAQAFYYAGVVESLLEDDGSAILNLLQAADDIGQRGNQDPLLAGRVHRATADIHRRLFNLREALRNDSLALARFGEVPGNRDFISSIRLQIGYDHFNLGQTDSASRVARDLEREGLASSESEVLAANCLFSDRRYGDALACYRKALSSPGTTLKENDLGRMYEACLQTGDRAAADSIFDMARTAGTDTTYLHMVRSVSDGDYSTAFHMLARELDAQNECFGDIISRNLPGIIESYFVRRQQVLERRHAERKAVAATITGLLLVIASATVYLLVRRHRRLRLRFALEHEALGRLSERLAAVDAMLRDAHARAERESGSAKNAARYLGDARDTLSRQLRSLSRILEGYAGRKDFRENGIFDKIREPFVRQYGTYTAPEYVAIEKSVNLLFDGVCLNLREAMPGIKDDSMIIFVYSVIGMTPSEIAILLGVKTTQVYSRKAYLAKKIQTLGNAPEFQRYL